MNPDSAPRARLPRWGERTLVMGVLNLTPDSFSDGGRLNGVPAALKAASRMLAQGADLLDLGGQSTRPGAREIGTDEELARVLPALQAIRAAHPEVLLSVDTFRAPVAAAALAAGADWINDVRGASGSGPGDGGHGDGQCSDAPHSLRDPGMLELIAAAGCPYVLMHSRGDSRSMDGLAQYNDVVEEVGQELLEASAQALAAGVRREQLIWDPGLGFAKDTDQNLTLLRGLAQLRAEGYPLLVGPSRKRFIGAVLAEARPRARLWGTAAVCVQAIGAGADVLRVHDVGPIAQVARMADALRNGALTTKHKPS